jgi:hypothetical protein
VDNIDNSAAQVKGYEVYYRSQNQAGRTGTGDQFVQAIEVFPSADFEDFEDAAGIIPASAVESDGDLDFTVRVNEYPFAGDGGSYGPIEWKVRAVSINNVRSDFTDVITTGDNIMPELRSAYKRENNSGEVESVVLRFIEALDSGTVSTSAFTVLEDGNVLSLAGTSLENAMPEQSDGEPTTVELTLTTPADDVDLVEVNDAETTDPVTDLAGNGMNPDDDSASIFWGRSLLLFKTVD